jgi:DNA-binding transcriptional LysR family regulator
MNNLQIKYFLGIVNNHLNFTRASGVLYVSQSALSRQIHSLEEELGFKLFDTSVKSATRLTPIGERYYRFFTEYTNDFIKVLKEARRVNNQLSGEIKMAVPQGWTLSAISKKIDLFRSKYPRITISLSSVGFNSIETGIKNNNYDIAITPSFHLKFLETLENIRKKEIATIPIILLYSSKHILAEKENLSITDFKDDVLYTVSEEDTPTAKAMSESCCKSKEFIPEIKTLANLDSVLLAIEGGSGFTLLNHWMRTKDHPSFRYIELDITDSVCMIWKKDNPNASLNLFLNNW